MTKKDAAIETSESGLSAPQKRLLLPLTWEEVMELGQSADDLEMCLVRMDLELMDLFDLAQDRIKKGKTPLLKADKRRVFELTRMAVALDEPAMWGYLEDLYAIICEVRVECKPCRDGLKDKWETAVNLEAAEEPDPKGKYPSLLKEAELVRKTFDPDGKCEFRGRNHRHTIDNWRKKSIYFDTVAERRFLLRQKGPKDRRLEMAHYIEKVIETGFVNKTD